MCDVIRKYNLYRGDRQLGITFSRKGGVERGALVVVRDEDYKKPPSSTTFFYNVFLTFPLAPTFFVIFLCFYYFHVNLILIPSTHPRIHSLQSFVCSSLVKSHLNQVCGLNVFSCLFFFFKSIFKKEKQIIFI